jgi:dipeptidyl aminopeptidase/acylaminoacyl peptidase
MVSSTRNEIWFVPLDSPEKRYPLLKAGYDFRGPRVSPDGAWIAYESNETGRNEIYVQGFPSGTGKRQVSAEGGSLARWSRDERELYFLAPDGKSMAAEVLKKGSIIEPGAPTALFVTRIVGGSGYDVGKDGRFLIPIPTEQSGPPMTVVLNWQTGLKK